MKPKSSNAVRSFLIIIIAGLSISLVAWQQKQHNQQYPGHEVAAQDTIPKKKDGHERKIRDLDDVLDELDDAKMELDLEKLNAELAKIGPQIEKELAKAHIEVEKAIKQIDMKNIQEEVNASIAKIDWDELKKNLQEIKKVQVDNLDIKLDEVNEQLKKIKPQIEKSLKEAKVEIEKAKAEMKEYKAFVDGLEKDGLINKKEGYTIKHKNGELIINGKTQPAEVYNKYRDFLKKHETLRIEKSDDDFDIDND